MQQFPGRPRILRGLSSPWDLLRPLLLVIPMEEQSQCSLCYVIPNWCGRWFFVEPPIPGALASTVEGKDVVKERQALREEMMQAFASGDAERIVKTYLARVAPGAYDSATPEARNIYVANVPAFELDFTAPRQPVACEDLHRIPVPALVLTGGRSAAGLQQVAAEVARCLKSGSILKLPQATHHMQLDHPQEVNDAMLEFLAKH